jgi:SAM-dependent methyltransferase
MVKPFENSAPSTAVEWTSARIRSFWGRFDDRPDNDNAHFGLQRGAAVLNFVKKHVRLTGPVLDLGCASGHLLDYMVDRGIRCAGADITLRPLAIARQRLSGHSNFLGVVALSDRHSLPYKTGSFEAVFLLETIEHLFPDQSVQLMREIKRILRPGGRLIVTAPNNEDLAAHSIVCPTCGLSFHRVQHLRSFTRHSLRTALVDAGYCDVICSVTPLLPDWKIWLKAQRHPRKIPGGCPACKAEFANTPVGAWRRIRDLFEELLHLICIAENPSR